MKWIILFFVLLFLLFNLTSAKSSPINCHARVIDLNEQKEIILERGGIWSLFEKYPELKKSSARGLRLDQQINRLVNLSIYICETIRGVPLNDLAVYVIESVEELGEHKFRDQLRIFGKPEKEVDDWFRYTQFAIKFQKRLLNPERVKNSLSESAELLKLFNDLTKNPINPNSLLRETVRLTEQIQNFLKNDPNMSQAIFEKAQEPYWDIDENYGGS
tara:strand:- start:3654 stop:4304 length:651 start_codon:yes stop_codon:yes gene_type:complete